jgi:hypothetical protein
MSKVELRPLTPEAHALAMRVHDLIKDAKPGELVTLPADLVRAIDDAALAAATPALIEIRKRERRLSWLHSSAACNVDGYEWGIFRVKWKDGQPAEVWQTNADFSDLDAAIEGSAVAGVAGLAASSPQRPMVMLTEEARDAAKWRALLSCARVRPLGSAGCERDEEHNADYAHIGFELWTHYNLTPKQSEDAERGRALGQKWLERFIEKAQRVAAKNGAAEAQPVAAGSAIDGVLEGRK